MSDDVWHRAVQIVSNNEDLQVYSVRIMYEALIRDNVHEMSVKVGGYLLGEYGYLLADAEEDPVSGDAQFDALYTHFDDVSNATKVIEGSRDGAQVKMKARGWQAFEYSSKRAKHAGGMMDGWIDVWMQRRIHG